MAAIPKASLSAQLKRATSSQPATSFRHFLLVPKTKVGAYQSRAAEKRLPREKRHGSGQEGSRLWAEALSEGKTEESGRTCRVLTEALDRGQDCTVPVFCR